MAECIEEKYRSSLDNVIDQYWLEKNLNDEWSTHYHRCEFDMIWGDKWGKKMCIEYLKEKGTKRDECMVCCDSCNKDMMIVMDERDDILFTHSPNRQSREK